VIPRQLQHRHYLAAFLPTANERGIAPAPKRQRQRVEQDRLAGTGFAGQHGHAAIQRQIELIDENDVANRKRVQHARIPRVRKAAGAADLLTHVTIPAPIARMTVPLSQQTSS
jgi:hypothetical protein